jgi:mono/diheme cytochrome c family protein
MGRPALRLHASWAAACLLLGCLACGEEKTPPGPPSAEKLFVAQNCSMCHAVDGAGGKLGPPLRKLADNWTRERLAEYLSDPKALVEKDPRLKALARNYSMPMPPVRLDLEQRLRLADYVLGF